MHTRLRSLLVSVCLAAGLVVATAAGAMAAANPSGHGQPNASCEVSTVKPHGFSTVGFLHAETVYAGNGKSANHAGSDHAVSQYDVACFQLSAHH